MPAGRTIFAVDNSLNEVVVLDGSVTPVNPVCFIAVGTSPTNLALSPDPNNPLLLVENDGDATVTVVDLNTVSVVGTVTLTSVAKPMTANIGVSPDAKFVYVVSLPGTVVAGTTQASLTKFSLPVPAGASAASIVTTLPTAVNGPGLGVAFVPDSTGVQSNFKAFIATEGASYAVTVATETTPATLVDSANGNASVIAGAAAVDPGGSFAYSVDASSTATNAIVYRTATNTNTTGGLTGVTPMCTFASTSAVTGPNTPTAQRAYYTCAGSNFIQAIDTGTNSQTAVGHVVVNAAPASPTAHPQGIAIPYDGVTAYVGLDDGHLTVVDIGTNTTSAPVAVSTSLRAIGFRPIKISGLSPLAPSVPTGTNQQFTSVLGFAQGTTLIWTVNGLAPVAGVSGNATVGTIDSNGKYTAPQKIPAGGTVQIGVTAPDAAPVSIFYPLTTTVTITPSQLAFTVQPTNVTAGSSIIPAVQVSIEDAAGSVVTAATNAVTIAIGTNPAAGTLSGTLTVNAVAGVATFSNLSIDRAGVGYTLVASSGTLTAATSTAFNVTAGPPAKLAFAVQPTNVVAGTAITPAVQVSVQDSLGNLVPTATNSVTVAIGTNPGGGTLSGTATVNAVAGVATFSNLSINKTGTGYTLAATSGVLTGATSTAFNVTPGTATQLLFTTQPPANGTAGSPLTAAVVSVEDALGNVVTTSVASIAITSTPTNVGGTTTLSATNGVATFNNLIFTAVGSYTLTAASSGLTSATSSSVTISPGPPAKLAFTTQPPPTSALGGNVTPSAAVAVSVQDAFGNLETTSSVPITISSTPTNVGGTTTAPATNGVATFSNLLFTIAGNNYTLTAASAPLTSTNSNSFALTTAIAVANTTGFTSVLIEDLPGGTDKFTAVPNGDPNVPKLGVTWKMISCGGSAVNLVPCGIVAANGSYTPPQIVPPATGATPLNTFVAQATAVADPTKTTVTGNIAIGSTVAVAVAPPTTTPASTVLIEQQYTFTVTVQNDPGLLGVKLTLICPDVNPCGSLGTPGAPTGTGSGYTVSVPYTAPTTVLATASHATVSATSLADPSKPAGSAMVTVTSNIKVTGITPTTPVSNQVVFGTPARFVDSITGTASITSVTWKVTCTAPAPAGSCGSIDAQGNYLAPAVPPNPATFTVTATSVADPSRSFTTPAVTIDADLLLNDPQNTSVSVASTSSSGSATVDFFGPSPANAGSFNIACQIVPTSGSFSGGNCIVSLSPPPSTTPLPTPVTLSGANGQNPIYVTLSVLRGTGAPPLRTPPSGPSGFRGFPVTLTLLLFALIAVLFFQFTGRDQLRFKRGYAFSILLFLTIGWVSACNQFSAPGQLPPLVGATQQAKGNLVITATPTGSGFATQTVQVAFQVN
jgi:hypothetical protein